MTTQGADDSTIDVHMALDDLTIPCDVLPARTSCIDIDAWFRSHPERESVVVDDAGMVSAVAKSAFYQALAGPRGFGWVLFSSKPLGDAVDLDGRCLDGSMPAVDAAVQLLTAGYASGEVLVRMACGSYGTARLTDIHVQLTRAYRLRAGQLAFSERRFRTLVESISDVVLVLDADARVTYLSPSAQRITRRDPELARGADAFAMVHPEDVAAARLLFERALLSPCLEIYGTVRLESADGAWQFVDLSLRNLLGDPSIGGVVVTMSDVSTHRELAEQLRHQAFHDALTGLANRALFSDRVEHACERLDRSTGTIAVIYCDLDGFKAINDTHGHGAGDRLLIAVAERFRNVVRSADTLARLGGDEFAVVLEEVRDERAAIHAARRMLEALREPFELDGTTVITRASLGVAVLDEYGVRAEELIRRADVAMYAAKAGGKATYRIWETALEQTVVRRHFLAEQLPAAMASGSLFLHYQPLVAVGSGDIVGVEALVRWSHETLGNIPPSDFIPVAEERGLIGELGAFVLERACCEVLPWTAPSGAPLLVSVNVSVAQLVESFPREVSGVLARSGLDPARLELEITESALVDNIEATRRVLVELKALGVRLAIDDFGTGYSSLAYLRQYPIDTLKLDKSFVAGLGGDEQDDRVLVDGVIRLAHALDLRVTAEGIETAAQLEALAQMQCDRGQGYHFARPLPACDLAALLDSFAAVSLQEHSRAPVGRLA